MQLLLLWWRRLCLFEKSRRSSKMKRTKATTCDCCSCSTLYKHSTSASTTGTDSPPLLGELIGRIGILIRMHLVRYRQIASIRFGIAWGAIWNGLGF